ncbi:MAG: helix-turn-helix domain-containing protein [Veillonellaceae bacterium]|nr:helix-turn-helix domain-containing protein [Veillonellaceae bacterium]
MTILQKLTIINKEQELTQEKLAALLGVSFATVNSWLNGRSLPRPQKQQLIDELYKKVTGQTQIPSSELVAKKDLLVKKSRQFPKILEYIKSRPDLFDQFVLSLTYHSNSLEGSSLTENDTAAIIFDNVAIPHKSVIEHLEAKNHQTALEYLFSTVKPAARLSEEYILKLHGLIMNSIRADAGFYRNHGVRIVGTNVPTANHAKIPTLMAELVADINQNDKDVIGHCARVHSRFEQIHPFADGNGRVGRLLMYSMLLRRNYPPALIKQEHKMAYNQYLNKAQMSGENSLLENFLCEAMTFSFDLLWDPDSAWAVTDKRTSHRKTG